MCVNTRANRKHLEHGTEHGNLINLRPSPADESPPLTRGCNNNDSNVMGKKLRECENGKSPGHPSLALNGNQAKPFSQ